MGPPVIEAEAKAIATLDRQEGRDVKDLAALEPGIRLDRPAVVVMDQIAVALAEGIVDLAQHGAQVACAVAAEPEADRIEDVAQHARQGHQHDLAVADLAEAVLAQEASQPSS